MPGVGGVKAANYLASIAPHDGTTLHMIMSNMMSSEAIGAQGVQFDTRKFFWIGNTTSTPNVTVSWYKSGVTTIDQVKARELIVGAPGGTAGVIYVTAMNGLLGTKFKLVTGYPGGNEVNLALERGEIDGRASNSWAAWKSTHPDWVKDRKIVVLVQIGLKRAPDLKDVPLLFELANNDMDRQVLTFLSASARAGDVPGHAGRARHRAAAGLRCNHARSRIPRRSRQGAVGYRSDERRRLPEDRRLDRQYAACCRGRRQRTEDRGQTTEDRRQRTDDRGQIWKRSL